MKTVVLIAFLFVNTCKQSLKNSRFPNLNSIYDVLTHSNFWDLIGFQVWKLIFAYSYKSLYKLLKIIKSVR
jgi:hypothetical protein